MMTLRARARSMVTALAALPMVAAIGLILDHARRW
jgi:hypothetical protein